jgi:putative lipoic acid-binding regulatory protein
MVDFIEIKRFSTSFPYKIYGRIENNVVSNVKKLIRETKSK